MDGKELSTQDVYTCTMHKCNYRSHTLDIISYEMLADRHPITEPLPLWDEHGNNDFYFYFILFY